MHVLIMSDVFFACLEITEGNSSNISCLSISRASFDFFFFKKKTNNAISAVNFSGVNLCMDVTYMHRCLQQCKLRTWDVWEQFEVGL